VEENEQYSLKEELEKTLAGEAAEALRDRDSVEEKAEGSRDKAPVLSLQEEIEREDALSLQEEEDLLEALLFSLGRTVSLEEMAICLHMGVDGAELAAEYVVETLSYAWNTGDTQPFADITEAGVKFHDSTIDSVNTVYRNGWVYGNTSSITGILSVEPITDSKWGAQPDSIGVIFKVATTNGTACMGQRIVVSDSPFDVRVVLFMTWKEGRWIATEGSISNYEEK